MYGYHILYLRIFNTCQENENFHTAGSKDDLFRFGVVCVLSMDSKMLISHLITGNEIKSPSSSSYPPSPSHSCQAPIHSKKWRFLLHVREKAWPPPWNGNKGLTRKINWIFVLSPSISCNKALCAFPQSMCVPSPLVLRSREIKKSQLLHFLAPSVQYLVATVCFFVNGLFRIKSIMLKYCWLRKKTGTIQRLIGVAGNRWTEKGARLWLLLLVWQDEGGSAHLLSPALWRVTHTTSCSAPSFLPAY